MRSDALHTRMSVEDELEYRTRVVKKLNIDRAILGMPPIVPKIRNCLSCDAEFVSIGNHVRKCGYCRSSDRRKDDELI